MDELPIGRRVAYWRGRRRMSQQVFADRMGMSKSWVDKVERGVRRLDKFSTVYQIADVLQLDVQLLLGKEPERPYGNHSWSIDQVDVEEIRAALECYDGIAAFFHTAPPAPELAEVCKAVTHAWLTYQHGKYTVLGRALPRLMRQARMADAAYAGCARPLRCQAAGLLGQVYQITASTLRKLGEHELSWIAADRSVEACQRADDPLLAALATARVGYSLLALGRARPAMEVTVNIANRVAPGNGHGTSEERLSVYGALLLGGSAAAARLGDSATVRELVVGAEEAARALGGDYNHYWTCFGPTNVQLQKAAAAVELGEGRAAIETHERLNGDGFAALLPSVRACHYLEIARAYTQVGDVDKAAEMLLEGDRQAPSEIRCRPIAHEVLADILRRSRGTLLPPPVAELAEAMGIGV